MRGGRFLRGTFFQQEDDRVVGQRAAKATLFFDGAAILPRARFHEFIYSVSPEAIFTGGSLN